MVKTSSMLYKTLVVGVIVLFIGVGIQPAFAINVSRSISDDEDNCDICPKVSKQHILRLKNWINKLETLNDRLSVISKNHPKVEEKCKILSDKITPLIEIKDKYLSSNSWPFPFLTAFCYVAAYLWYVYFSIIDFFILRLGILHGPK